MLQRMSTESPETELAARVVAAVKAEMRAFAVERRAGLCTGLAAVELLRLHAIAVAESGLLRALRELGFQLVPDSAN